MQGQHNILHNDLLFSLFIVKLVLEAQRTMTKQQTNAVIEQKQSRLQQDNSTALFYVVQNNGVTVIDHHHTGLLYFAALRLDSKIYYKCGVVCKVHLESQYIFNSDTLIQTMRV